MTSVAETHQSILDEMDVAPFALAIATLCLPTAAMSIATRLALAPMGFESASLSLLVGIHAGSTLIATLVALLADRLMRRWKAGLGRRFCLALILVFCGMIVLPAFIGWLPTISYYSQWGAPFPSVYWFLQRLFSLAGGIASYITTTLTPMMPLPILVSMATALLVTARRR